MPKCNVIFTFIDFSEILLKLNRKENFSVVIGHSLNFLHFQNIFVYLILKLKMQSVKLFAFKEDILLFQICHTFDPR